MSVFRSTRGAESVAFPEALFRGLAPDGGLYVPAELGRLDGDLPGRGSGPLRPLPTDTAFPESALWAAERLLADMLPPDVLHRITTEALDFDVPLVEVEDGVFVLELFHGPSLAFKDVGARFMARAMAALDGAEGRRTVLVATSGDTGGAVAAAFHGIERFRVVVLFPRKGISEGQRRQMTTLGDNVVAVSVAGTFDDCQRLAKGAFADRDLGEACGLTSANSINVGRLLPQAFYYVHAAARLGWRERPATFVVPSGNLGNLCAGLLAHRAGMPTTGFVAACNPNRPFVDYLETGVYRPRPSLPSLSNAMDVGDPSNLERIRWMYGDDVGRLRGDVRGVARDDDETRACIGDVYRRTGRLLDPHTAVAWSAMDEVSAAGVDGSPRVVLATAHPAKFPAVVEEATGVSVAPPAVLSETFRRPERMVSLDVDDRALAELLREGIAA
ncbi:MAG: threonine synthase [Gemmatimonadetes bacterium]|nr:threonine synthase [Gemmatimonadota bacterium]